MFYKQFLQLIDAVDIQFLNEFDFWLATLPDNQAQNISVSSVAARFEVGYSLAEIVIAYAYNNKILEKKYMILCSNQECEMPYQVVTGDELVPVLGKKIYCHECQEEFYVTPQNVVIVYKRIKKPNIPEADLKKEILKRLDFGEKFSSEKGNFNRADSLMDNIEDLYSLYYNPSESAYNKFELLKDKIDWDYGKSTTAKGKALEVLVLEIFNQIKGVKGTNDVKTKTNQFDCTCLCELTTVFPSVFSFLAPYFIIECKNEPEKKPNNSYCNKLLSIMETNEAQVGIIFGRMSATKPCFTIAREHYLKHSTSRKQQIILTFFDNDLVYLIDNRVNLLTYLSYKIFQITTNAPETTYEMFNKR